MQVKELNVTVTYRVGLQNLEIPQDVYDELVEAQENNDEINAGADNKYLKASDWLSNNIRESDCFDLSTQIDDLEADED